MSDFNQFEGQEADSGESEFQGENDLPVNQFLKGVAPEDLPVIQKYYPDWSSKVGKSFEKIHSQYAPYKSLNADPTTLGSAYDLWNRLNEDPKGTFGLIESALRQQGLLDDPQAKPQEQPDYGDLHPDIVAKLQKFDQLDQVVQVLAQKHLEAEKMRQEQEDQSEFEKYMAGLHKKHGDFDDEYVEAKILKGMDGEQAIQAYKKLAQNAVNSAVRPPQVMGRGNVMPTGQVNPAKMSSTEIEDYVATMLAQAANENR